MLFAVLILDLRVEILFADDEIVLIPEESPLFTDDKLFPCVRFSDQHYDFNRGAVIHAVYSRFYFFSFSFVGHCNYSSNWIRILLDKLYSLLSSVCLVYLVPLYWPNLFKILFLTSALRISFVLVSFSPRIFCA